MEWGVTWTPQSSGTERTLKGLAWTGSQLVAVGESGVILTSPDGKSWTTRKSEDFTDLNSVAWTGRQLVAVGQSGSCFASADGIHWANLGIPTSYDISTITWTGSLLVAGGNGTIFTSSEDGVLSVSPRNSVVKNMPRQYHRLYLLDGRRVSGADARGSIFGFPPILFRRH